MSYTTLRVTSAGVVLFDAHRARLGPTANDAFDAFSRTAAPGLYSLTVLDGALTVTPRPASRLEDGQPTRTLVSPIATSTGPQTKRASPSPWDTVRAPGVATLLTDPLGTEVYESCVAAVVAWNGESLVLVPERAPRVDSTAEHFMATHWPHVRAPIAPDHPALLLVNAVTLALPRASRFPAPLRAELEHALNATAKRASGMV